MQCLVVFLYGFPSDVRKDPGVVLLDLKKKLSSLLAGHSSQKLERVVEIVASRNPDCLINREMPSC